MKLSIGKREIVEMVIQQLRQGVLDNEMIDMIDLKDAKITVKTQTGTQEISLDQMEDKNLILELEL